MLFTRFKICHSFYLYNRQQYMVLYRSFNKHLFSHSIKSDIRFMDLCYPHPPSLPPTLGPPPPPSLTTRAFQMAPSSGGGPLTTATCRMVVQDDTQKRHTRGGEARQTQQRTWRALDEVSEQN
ncbi:unnamed protein product [Lota lota]